jgi:predicted permease
VTVLKQNLVFAFRSFRKHPGLTGVIVLTLALGIGANTAIFSVVYSALFRPLPYRNVQELLFLGESRDQAPAINTAQCSYPDFLDWKRSTKSFAALAGYSGDAFILDTGGEPKLTLAAQATPNFFATLGVKALLGRDFLDGEDLPDGPHVAILSYAFWRSEFGANPNVVGGTIRLDSKPVTIVGVLPRDFEFAPANSAPVWVPLHPTGDLGSRRSLRWFNAIGRLGPGVSSTQASAEMQGINAQLIQAHPIENASTVFLMTGFRDRIVGQVRPLLLVLLGAVSFVLLIACANVANLLLTRSISRRKEFAVRSTLGASRSDLVWQLLTESLLLSSLGAVAGAIAARWGVSVLIAAIPESILLAAPNLRAAGADFPVLAFLCGITIATGLLFGLAPALAASKASVNEVLKDESRGGTSSAHARLRNSLAIAEIAVCLVLLVGGGLLLQSLRALLHQNPGFDAKNVLTFDVNLPDATYPSETTYPYRNDSANRFTRDFSEKLRNSPGVISVASTTIVPVSGNGGTIRFLVEGRPTPAGKEDECSISDVSSDYFSTMRIPLVDGRFFSPDDTKPEAPQTVIVNRAFVKRYFPDENPVGKRIRFTFNEKQPFRQIVGVVGDVALIDLDALPPPVVYGPVEQAGDTYLSYLVRTAGEPLSFIATARNVLHDMDPRLPLIQPRTLEQIAAESPSVFLRRYPTLLIGSFAGLALVLAMIGLYGVISYTVSQRTREIGIRVAMGAQRTDVMRLVLREAVQMTAAGVGIGIVSGLLLTRLMRTLLFGISPSDSMTFACVAAFLFLVAIAACTIPVHRATRVDPIVALRYE